MKAGISLPVVEVLFWCAFERIC